MNNKILKKKVKIFKCKCGREIAYYPKFERPTEKNCGNCYMPLKVLNNNK